MSLESDSALPALPATISRYRIVERLASGEAGDVYKAFDPMIERLVVVKVLGTRRGAAPFDAGVKEVFYREMQKAGTLGHPAIAMLFDAGEAPQGLFMAAEFVEGRSLAALVTSDLDVPTRMAVIGRVVDALEFAHALNVPHLNLKPTSVRTRPDLTVKVSGFGVARVLRELGRVRQTPLFWVSRYTAPETVSGTNGGVASDVFGLAAITCELLGGEPPFDNPGPEPVGVLAERTGRRPARLTDLGFDDRAWADTFGRALSSDPNHRFPTVTAFLTAVSNVLGITRPAASKVWSGSSRVVLADVAGEHASSIDNSSTGGDSSVPSEPPPVEVAPEESATWAETAVPAPASEPRVEPEPAAIPPPALVYPALNPEPQAPPLLRPPPAATPRAAAPAALPPKSDRPRRALPVSAAMLAGLLVGGTGMALIWFKVPAVRRLVSQTSTGSPRSSPNQVAPESMPSSDNAANAPVLSPPANEPPAPVTSDTESTPSPAEVATPPAVTARVTTGQLRIVTSPPGATVAVDGRARGVTPLRLGNLTFSDHTVRVSLEGYVADEQRVSLTPNQAVRTVAVRLRVLIIEPAPAGVSVSTDPSGAAIFLDDVAIGESPASAPKVTSGKHTVRAEREGFEPASREIDVQAGETANVALRLTPKVTPAPAGPIEFERVQVKPRQVSGRASPRYPPSARSAKLTGAVLASWIVDENGNVTAPSVLESSSPLFETEVLNWLRSLHYVPGQQDGRPMKVVVKRRFTFAIGREE